MTNKRVHILTKMLLFLIAFFISTSIVYHFTPTIQVHAERNGNNGTYYEGQGEGGATTTMTLQGGPSYKKTCIGIYIAEKDDGEPASNVILISNDESILGRSQEAYKIDCKDESFNWSLHVAHFEPTSLLPYPVNYVGGKFVPNGNEVAKYLTTLIDGTPRWQTFAQDNWSQDPVDNTTVYNKLMENPEDYVLVVVPIAWMNAYDNNKNMGNLIIATADGWAKYYRGKNMPEGCKYTNAMTHEGLPYSMTVHGTWFNGKLRGHDGERARKLTNDEILTEGYAMHIIELDGAVIHTYDEPEGSPGKPQNNDDPRGGEYDIVKCYRTYNETSNTYTDDGTFYRQSCVNKVSVDEEPLYRIVRWDTSGTTDITMKSTDYKPVNPIQQGLTADKVTLKKSNNEKCIYVLLEKKESEDVEEQDYNYILPQSRVTRRIWFSQPEKALQVGGSDFQIKDHTFEWYRVYHDNRCTQRDGGHNWYSDCDRHHTRPTSDGGTEHYDCGENCVKHTEYCDETSTDSATDSTWKWKFHDRAIHLSIYNSKKYDATYKNILVSKEDYTKGYGEIKPSQHPFNKAWADKTQAGSDEYDYSTQRYSETGWDYVCLIHRGQDKLTVLKYKNENLGANVANTELTNLSANTDNYTVANTDSGTRKLQTYYDKFSANFVNDTYTNGFDVNTKFGSVKAAPHGGRCSIESLNFRFSDNHPPLAINDIGVKVETYSGSTSGGYNDITTGLPNQTIYNINYDGSNHNKTCGVMVESGGQVSFRPYIQMQYDTIASVDKKVYVIGEYQRTLTPNDYAEVAYVSGRGGKLTLSSLQWSTHQSGKQLSQDNQNKKILPGGATLSLSIKTSSPDDRRYVRVTSYQCYVDGAGKTQLDNIGGSSTLGTKSDADSEHSAFVETVRSGLDNLNMQQWVNKNSGNPFSGIPVDNYENTNISSLGNGAKGGKVTDDNKYYLANEGVGSLASEGDLDVQVGTTTSTVYTFFTNTKDLH